MVWMAEEAGEYERLAALIDQIESESASNKSVTTFLDISEMMAKSDVKKHMTYKEALDVIDEVESKGRRPAREVQAERLKVQEQRRQQAQGSHAVTSGVLQTPFAQPSPPKPAAKTKAPEMPAPREIEAQRKEGVASELGAIASRLGGMKPSMPSLKMKKRVNINDLVLPNLSLADQISELERISEGLRGMMFDQDHLGIVKEEVYGLQQVVNQEKKKSKGKSSLPAGSLEQSMRELRDERLADVELLLDKGGGS